MIHRRFFVPKEAILKDQIIITAKNDIHKIKEVLRLKKGDKLHLLDGLGGQYVAEILSLSENEILCNILERRHLTAEEYFYITIAQSLIKKRLFELVIQKTTELGITEIAPFVSLRSVVIPDSVSQENRYRRWTRIIKEASLQSGRDKPPLLNQINSFSGVLKGIKNYELALILFEAEKRRLRDILKERLSRKIILFIGPEGGFTQNEIEEAKSYGALSVSLGKQILRAETAGIVAPSILLYELGMLG